MSANAALRSPPSRRLAVAEPTPVDRDTWRWKIDGSDALYHGTMPPGFHDHGFVNAHHLGEVLLWLTEHGEFWGQIDDTQPVTFTIQRCVDDGQ
jgi:hypothetical protein